jgi:hypothetical protein
VNIKKNHFGGKNGLNDDFFSHRWNLASLLFLPFPTLKNNTNKLFFIKTDFV